MIDTTVVLPGVDCIDAWVAGGDLFIRQREPGDDEAVILIPGAFIGAFMHALQKTIKAA